MKKFLLFLAGAVAGILVSFCLAYVSGYILENMGVILYKSESDQQRNFNIFIILGLVVSLIFGWLSVRYGLTKSSSGR
ncbi:MAG: hypothetical protein CSA09_03530 [Candidatus Contendobacter odensis]|uniref:Uncharacterized protein n=1 Tax=Candidatus Contendibacter odensensis TaxID=1400860 RepID=A0A2G6PF03_9GAMM|nr:MAG: hypothetical protein CSA09_03530 [Candidatus Contendobacter odensis]